jgi:hypothetical protein
VVATAQDARRNPLDSNFSTCQSHINEPDPESVVLSKFDAPEDTSAGKRVSNEKDIWDPIACPVSSKAFFAAAMSAWRGAAGAILRANMSGSIAGSLGSSPLLSSIRLSVDLPAPLQPA